MLLKERIKPKNPVLTQRVSRRDLLAGAVGAAGLVSLSSDGTRSELDNARVDLVAVKENLQFVGDTVSTWMERLIKAHTPKGEVPSFGTSLEIPELGTMISVGQESNVRVVNIQRTDIIKSASQTEDTKYTSIIYSVDDNNKVVSAGSETTVFRGNPPQHDPNGNRIQLREDQQFLILVQNLPTEEFGSLIIRSNNDDTPHKLTTQPNDTTPLTGEALKGFIQSVADAMRTIAA